MTQDVYEVGALRVEVHERRVLHRGSVLPVGGKAFDLLAVLAQRAGSLFRHDELLERVWPDVVVEPNNLAHNVSVLRKAMAGIDDVRIETVPRQGYRLVATDARSPASSVDGQEIGFCRAADGVRLAYARAGSGPPLVKVAHWLSHVELDWDSPMWRHWLEFLSDGRTLLRYDARGNGLSQWEVEHLDFERFVVDLERVMDEAGVDRAPLLGQSQGAAVAVAFAARHPERVTGLLLVGGCARGWRVKDHPALTELFEALMTLMRGGWGQDNEAFRQLFTTAFFPEASAEQAAYFNELQRTTTTPDNAARILDALGRVDVRDDLAAIRVPTLVLHARHDAVVPFRDGLELATGVEGARFVPLESRNHVLLPAEPAWSRFCAEASRFLDALRNT